MNEHEVTPAAADTDSHTTWQPRPSGALSASGQLSDFPAESPAPAPASEIADAGTGAEGSSPTATSPDAAQPQPHYPAADPATRQWQRPAAANAGYPGSDAQPAGESGRARSFSLPPSPTSPLARPGFAPDSTGSASFTPGGSRSSWPQPAWTAPGATTPPGPSGNSPDTSANPPTRKMRSALAVTAIIALAFVAGLGGGIVGNSLGNDTAASSTPPLATITQQAAAMPQASSGSDGSSVSAAAAAILPSVVSVVAKAGVTGGEGSGVVLTESGMILTNNHVIEGAQQLTVQFNDGTAAAATVIGADPMDDLAVIKVSGVSGLTPAALGTSASLAVGEQVVAVGSPLGLSSTVTSGIISALNRPVRTSTAAGPSDKDTVLSAIQTDAAINPGNSGGPLVNMTGHVIGINTAIAAMSSPAQSQAGSIGVGFAIPIDQAYRIAQEIINTGTATHAVLGARVTDATNDSTGLSIGAQLVDISPDSGAEAANLRAGDVVTKINDTMIESSDALVATIRSAAPGSEVEVTYVRDSDTATVTVTLGSSTD